MRTFSVLLIVLVVAHSVASAATLYVGSDPGEFPTIQGALDAATAGDTIIVREGTYVENIVIDKPGIQLASDIPNGANIEGTITVTSQAGGLFVSGILSQGTTVDIQDRIDWPAVLPTGTSHQILAVSDSDAGIEIQMRDIAANVNYDSVTGAAILIGGSGTINHVGNIALENSAADSSARGVSLITGDDAEATIDAIEVEAGSISVGAHYFTGDNGHITVIGGIDSKARNAGSSASGIGIRGGTNMYGSLGNINVEGGATAIGVDFNVTTGGYLDQRGDVTVYAKDVVSSGYGVALGADEGFVATIGHVTVDAGALARGVTTTYPPGTIVNTEGLKNNADLYVAGTIAVTAREADSEAYGIDLEGEEDLFLRVGDVGMSVDVEGGRLARGILVQTTGDGGGLTHVGSVTATARDAGSQAFGVEVAVADDFSVSVGDVTVQSDGLARAVAYAGGHGGSLAVEGDLRVTSGTAHAHGVLVHAGNQFQTTVGNVKVEGGGTAVQGVAFNVENGGSLSHGGRIEVTGTATDSNARGINVIAQDDFAATIGDVAVSGVTNALGVYWASSDGAELIHTGSIDVSATAASGSVAGATIVVGDDASVALGHIQATAVQSSWGVTLEAGERATLEVDSITSIAEGGDAQAYGLQVVGSETMSVSIHDDIVVNAGGAGGGASIARGLVVQSPEADVTNSGYMKVVANDAVAVAFGPSTAMEKITFHNDGIIETSGDSGTGVVVNVSDEATVRNNGVIDAGGGVALAGTASTGSISLVNSGTIVGDVFTGQGADQLELIGGAELDGNVQLGAGNDTVTMDHGALLGGLLDGGAGSDTLTLRGDGGSSLPEGSTWTRVFARDFERTWVHGGAWHWSPNSEFGEVDVVDAFVRIEGDVNVTTMSLHDGALIGEGTVVGNVVNEAGVVSPGNSYGILTIRGNYTQGPDGVLQIELDATTVPIAGASYDQLVIVDGTALFEDGTTLRIRPTYGPELLDRAEYILVAGDVVFDPNTMNLELELPNRLFYEGWLEEGSMKLVLAVTGFDGIAETDSQKAVADVITQAKGEPGTDLGDLYDWLKSLTPDQADEATTAYDSLTGEVYTHLPSLIARRLDNMVGTIGSGIRQREIDPQRNLWIVPYSNMGRIASGDGTVGSRFYQSAVVAGVDVFEFGHTRIGLDLGAGLDRLVMDERGSDIQGQGLQYGLYAHTSVGGARLTTSLGYGTTTYRSLRDIRFGTTLHLAEAQFKTKQWAASVEGGIGLVDSEDVTIETTASLGYYGMEHSDFEETGAGTLGLIVDGREERWWQGRVALTATGAPGSLGIGWVRPQVSLAWVTERPTVERVYVGRLRGAAGHPFTIRGTEARDSGFEASIGLHSEGDRGSVWSLEYTGEFRMDRSSHRLMARVEFGF